MNQENTDGKTQSVRTSEEYESLNQHPHNLPSALAQVDLAGHSHRGHIRNNNEDHYLAVRMTRSLETLLTNLKHDARATRFDETAYAMLVADGMGGMAAGEIASSVALMTLMDLVVQTPDWIMRMKERENAAIVMRRMTNRFRQIDDEMRQLGESERALRGMGTTLTVTASLGTDLILSHIGDSRAYLFRNEKLHQLTSDHTLAQAFIDAGIAGPDDTATRAMRHVLTAALGSTGVPTDPQVLRLHLNEGDQVLLCTDGLSEMVSDEAIASVLTATDSSTAACQTLVDLALDEGGKDNVTVVLGRYHFPRESAEKE